MHNFKRRMGQAFLRANVSRLAVFCLTLLLLADLLPGRAAGAELSEEAAVRAAAETILRSYEEAAMLYMDRDLRAGTVAESSVLLPAGEEESRSIRVFGKDMTLDQLPGNIVFLEKKAEFYAAMRQMQGIYREDLRLNYRMEELELTEDTAKASIRETAQFRYTDSDRQSVYETFYTVYLLKLEGRWLIAGVTDGSRFDKLYRDQGAAFDQGAALAEFAKQLEEENCRVTFPYTPFDSKERIPYNGASAAAYAYTYSRVTAGTPRSEFYNPLFTGYAGTWTRRGRTSITPSLWATPVRAETARILPLSACGRDSAAAKAPSANTACPWTRRGTTSGLAAPPPEERPTMPGSAASPSESI